MEYIKFSLKVCVKIHSICVCVCVCVCVKVKKDIFKVFINLKTNEKPMVNNQNYSINKIFNETILKKLTHATRRYATSCS